MSDDFARNVLKVAMAQICQNLGWHAVQTTPMNILVDILQRYLCTVAKITHQYAEHYNRNEPNLNDIGLAFKDLGISLTELEEYISNVEPVPFAHPVPKFPVARNNQFNFPKENSREVSARPEWIDPHLPCVYPEVEDSPPSPTEDADGKATDGQVSEVPSPSSSPRPGVRRPLEVTPDTNNFPLAKRPRLLSDEEGRPVREVVSVSMTPAGLISPCREGRLPDSCTPLKGFEDSKPSSPVVSEEAEETPPPSVAPVEPPPVVKPVAPPEVIKVRKPKIKDGSKHRIKIQKIKKENKESTKKKDSKESKSKKKDALKHAMKAQLKVKDKLAKLAKANKLKNYKLPKLPKLSKIPKLPKAGLESSKHDKKLGRSKKLKSSSSVGIKTESGLSAQPAKHSTPNSGGIKFVKHNAKSPKVPKPPKASKTEKSVAGGHLATLLAKASSSGSGKVDKLDKFLPEFKSDAYPRVDSPPVRPSSSSNFSPGNFQEHRNVSDNYAHDTPNQRVLNEYDHYANSNSCSSNVRSDSEGIPSFRSKIKLEPKDVYDFTDDEDNRNVSANDECREKKSEPPIVPIRSPEMSPPFQEMVRPVIPGPDIKPPIKKRGRPRKYPKKEPDVIPNIINQRPRTPEPFDRSPPMVPMQQQRSPFSGVSSFGVPPLSQPMSYYPSLANIPPALLPVFPMSSYSVPPSQPPHSTPPPMPMGSPVASTSSMASCIKLVDLANVAISQAEDEGYLDLSRAKDKEKVKRKGKRDKKDKDKQKLKKKKDKEKLKDKNSDKVKVEKGKDKQKTKKVKSGDGSGKSKDKKEKSEKSKDKKRDKAKDKEKKAEKKKDKLPKLDKDDFREDKEVDRLPSPAPAAAIPRLTFKLGSGAESDSPKM
ncbi:hypothetical protein CHUAL_007086 [Chamberlinius hualienensis]